MGFLSLNLVFWRQERTPSSALSISSEAPCVGDAAREGSGGKEARLRSPFHLLLSEMKWPSQVCGGVRRAAGRALEC